MWFDETSKTKNPHLEKLYANTGKEYSHDNIFHTILGLTDVSSSIYEKSKDITAL